MTAPTSTERVRIQEGYLRMAAEAQYRPAAPGDGFGTFHLTEEELADPQLLAEEARDYAAAFIRQEDTRQFHIGCSNWSTNRALVFTIEAARLLCTGSCDELALKLLQMAHRRSEGSESRHDQTRLLRHIEKRSSESCDTRRFAGRGSHAGTVAEFLFARSAARRAIHRLTHRGPHEHRAGTDE